MTDFENILKANKIEYVDYSTLNGHHFIINHRDYGKYFANPKSIFHNDYKRFITQSAVTKDGEVADNNVLSLNTKQIEKEEQYDGFYGVCTNLDDNAEEIIKINQRRWEIEGGDLLSSVGGGPEQAEEIR